MTASRIHPILGTMTFGGKAQVKHDEVTVMLRTFCGAGCAKTPSGVHLDTARLYQADAGDEDTESTLGECIEPSMHRRIFMATKVNASVGPHCSLSRQSVLEQCELSLSKLQVDCIELLYLHWPDVKTSIDETLDAISELHSNGKFKEFGLSNYPAWMVVDIWHRCKNRGMVCPTVYQGMYNVITRDLERELVPVVRQLGMRLYVYNPLAGGLLSGRYTSMEAVSDALEGRFSSEVGTTGKTYQARYLKSAVFGGVQKILTACQAPDPPQEQVEAAPEVTHTEESVVQGVKVTLQVTESAAPRPGGGAREQMASVALRWLLHHSQLQAGDGIIIGVSKPGHLMANLAAWHQGPLPADILEACNEAWEVARPACEPYFRGLGASPGGTELFLSQLEKAALEAEQTKSDDAAAKA